MLAPADGGGRTPSFVEEPLVGLGLATVHEQHVERRDDVPRNRDEIIRSEGRRRTPCGTRALDGDRPLLECREIAHEQRVAAVEMRLRELNRMMSSIGVLKRGGIVNIDFLPGKGTRIAVNGEDKLLIPGDDFFTALLRIWIGRKPVDGRLRDAMLGGGEGFRLF